MPRWIASTAATAVFTLALAGCTSMPPATPATTPSPQVGSGSASGTSAKNLPNCDEVTAAIGTLADPFALNAEASAIQTAPEDYDQRVCVYLSGDALSQVGITVATIPFQQTEIDGYATLPNAITDDRLAQYDGVLQTLATDDAADGHLDSPLYLFDTRYSITVQAVSTGEPIATLLPNLSVETATEAAFAVRALLN